MAYTPHVLAQFGGKLAGPPDDIWTCTLRLRTVGSLSAFDVQAYMTGVSGPLADWFQGNTSHIASNAYLQWLKVNKIGADGHYSDESNTHLHEYTTSHPGNFTPIAPAFCSLAMSFTTAHKRGRAHAGRMYLPNYTFASHGSSVLTADAQAMANAGELLIRDVFNSPTDGAGGTVIAAVYSKLDGSTNDIQQVRVGERYDVIRRRKNATRETYTLNTN